MAAISRPADRAVRPLALVAGPLLGAAGPLVVLARGRSWSGVAVVAGLAAAWILLVALVPRRPLLTWAALAASVPVALVVAPWPGAIAIAFAGSVVAAAALGGWQPFPRHPRRHPDQVALAVPFLAGAQLHWARGGAPLAALALVAVALAVVEAHHLSPEPMARVDRATRRTVARVAEAVGLVLVLVAAVPTLYLPGLIARAVGRRRPAPPSWRPVRTPPELVRRDASVPFLSTPPAARRLRGAVGLVVLAGLATAVVGARSEAGPEPAPTPSEALDALGSTGFSALPAFRSQEGAERLEAELDAAMAGLAFDPVTGSALPDFDGELVEIADGARRVPRPECRCPRLTVWMVGGSAGFGLGQRDERTVAAGLVRRAAEEGVALDVVDLSVPLWSLWPAHLAVTARLAGGGPRPDIVVHYGGFDDVLATVVLDAVGRLDPAVPAVLTPDDLVALGDREGGVTGQDGTALGRTAASRYWALAELIDTQLSEQGIDTVFALQPDLLATGAVDPASPLLSAGTAELLAGTALAAALDAAEEELDGRVLNLRSALDDRPEVFYDLSNVNEDGAEGVAEHLHRGLLPTYRDRLR